MAGNHKDSVPKQMRFRSMWTCAIGEYKTMCSKFLTAFRFDQSQILEYSCPCVCHSIASGAERRASFNKFHKTQGIFPDSFLARASACTYLYTDSAVKHMYNSPSPIQWCTSQGTHTTSTYNYFNFVTCVDFRHAMLAIMLSTLDCVTLLIRLHYIASSWMLAYVRPISLSIDILLFRIYDCCKYLLDEVRVTFWSLRGFTPHFSSRSPSVTTIACYSLLVSNIERLSYLAFNGLALA